MYHQIVTCPILTLLPSHTALDAFIASILGRNPAGGYRRANRPSCRFVSLVFLPPAGTCFLNHSHRYAFGPRIKYGAGSGTRWRHKSARSRFGHPKDAHRVGAMEGAHQKSSAIIASIGNGMVRPSLKHDLDGP